jgi:hypothetical protein
MDYEKLDPGLVRRAKKAAAGPLGQEMARFPLRFAQPVFFGDRPQKDKLQKVRNGTATLLNLNGRPIALTCSHVFQGYRGFHGDDPNTVFQIGALEFNPLDRIIDESASVDLVTIDLQGLDLDELRRDEPISCEFFTPARWPAENIKEDDFVAFGGFPGSWRQNPSSGVLVFDSWSAGATPVSSVSAGYFVCQFEREYWVESLKQRGCEGLGLRELGGLSGSPAFVHRSLYFELVGIAYEFSEDFDLMYARPVSLLRQDGTIAGILS